MNNTNQKAIEELALEERRAYFRQYSVPFWQHRPANLRPERS